MWLETLSLFQTEKRFAPCISEHVTPQINSQQNLNQKANPFIAKALSHGIGSKRTRSETWTGSACCLHETTLEPIQNSKCSFVSGLDPFQTGCCTVSCNHLAGPFRPLPNDSVSVRSRVNRSSLPPALVREMNPSRLKRNE